MITTFTETELKTQHETRGHSNFVPGCPACGERRKAFLLEGAVKFEGPLIRPDALARFEGGE